MIVASTIAREAAAFLVGSAASSATIAAAIPGYRRDFVFGA